MTFASPVPKPSTSIRYFAAVIGLLLAHHGEGQINAGRQKRVAVNDTLVLDSLSIFPGRLILLAGADTIPDSLYRAKYQTGTVYFKRLPEGDSLTAIYDVLPFVIRSTYQHKDPAVLILAEGRPISKYTITSAGDRSALFDDQSLNKSGSISRGIAFGNAQNLSVNSSLNLQMSGKITERYSLLASVSDDNIPIQPEGNTQQLQDFDQVFIQVFDDRNKLIAGDFILRRPEGYFLNYFKRSQGAYVQSTGINLSSGPIERTMSVEASASVSKGRFSRNVIQGVEGNQGPYRLVGENNELFIVVLAGTEAVYIDGRLMERGQDKDYVIDYNSAEITFTPKQFITKDRRITVEFQYSDKRYARPLIHTAVQVQTPKANYHLNVFSEHDAKNQPLQQELSDRDKRVLALAGDNPILAVTNGADSVGFSDNSVLYALRDSLSFDSVFVYSTHPDSALYRLTFTFVGAGNGDYIEDGFTASGRKFKWTLPEIVDQVWIRRGSYAPVITLFAPQKKQMITAGMTWNPGGRVKGHSTLLTEGAISVNDRNTFSSVDSGDDIGFAWKGGYLWKRSSSSSPDTLIGKARKNGLEISAGYEYTSRDFSRIERFRDVEFERNWNVQRLSLLNDQHIGSVLFKTEIPDVGTAGIGADMFAIGQSYLGRRVQALSRISTKKGTRAIVNASWLESSGQVNSSFIRHKSDLSQKLGALKIGFRDEHEYNRYYLNDSDSLSALSYRFYDWELSLGNSDTANYQISAFYRDRWDERPSPDLSRASRADHYGAVVGINGKTGNRIRAQISNRRLRVIDPELFTQQPENTLLTRVEYSFRFADGLLHGSTFYEVGSGLEQRREFIYLEVPAGQGNYVWIDYNENGSKELNEFEIAQFAYEANYIRSFVQTNDYVRTFTNQFSQTLWITPSQRWKKPSNRFQKIVGRFSNQTSFRADRKTQRENKNERLNPFITSIADSTLLSLNGSFRNVVFFNKSNPTFGADLTLQNVSNKSLLSSGFESRSDGFTQLAVRWNFYKAFTFVLEGREGSRRVASDFLAGRNYLLNQLSIRPKLNWQPGTVSRFSLSGEFTDKQNSSIDGGELATIRKAGFDWTVNNPEKGLVQANFQVVSISYSGEANTSLSFDMLEGLAPGLNLTWGAGLQRTVANNLQLNVIYNGRKPGELRIIHSGGVQVRAFF